MIRRFFSIWLILSISGYGIAMSAESHSSLDQDYEHSIQDHSDKQNHNDSADDLDHCGHAGLHLLGLHNNHKINTINNNQIIDASYLVNYTSPDTKRLIRPPVTI